MSPTLTEKLPRVGWTPMPLPRALALEPGSHSAWSDGKAHVLSSLIDAEAPDGSGEVIPQWHVSITERGRRATPRVLRRALRAFGMVGAEEDNHHPGNARHFFLPVDPARRVGCECKATETIQREPDGYTWTNPTDAPCRGCELALKLGRACPIHAGGIGDIRAPEPSGEEIVHARFEVPVEMITTSGEARDLFLVAETRAWKDILERIR